MDGNAIGGTLTGVAAIVTAYAGLKAAQAQASKQERADLLAEVRTMLEREEEQKEEET